MNSNWIKYFYFALITLFVFGQAQNIDFKAKKESLKFSEITQQTNQNGQFLEAEFWYETSPNNRSDNSSDLFFENLLDDEDEQKEKDEKKNKKSDGYLANPTHFINEEIRFPKQNFISGLSHFELSTQCNYLLYQVFRI